MGRSEALNWQSLKQGFFASCRVPPGSGGSSRTKRVKWWVGLTIRENNESYSSHSKVVSDALVTCTLPRFVS